MDHRRPRSRSRTGRVSASAGLLIASLGGMAEGHDDVDIRLSRKAVGGSWSAPDAVTHTPGMPVWNRVLFHDRRVLAESWAE